MAESRERISGRVAQILNARELVINRGTKHGVKRGMKFAILAETPHEIRDPETGEAIGLIDREKVRVLVTEVQSQLSVCATYRKKTVGEGGLGNFAAAGRLFQERKVVYETLAIGDLELPPPLEPEESYVRTNDRAIELTKEEADSE